MKKSFSPLIYFLLSALGAADQTQFEFSMSNDGGSIITGYNGPGGEVVIPNELGDNTVRAIASEAFLNNERVTGIIIPGSVTSIGDSAFYNSGLTSVNLPDSVTSIGDFAFENCVNLVSITIPKSVTSIGNFALNLCSNLTTIAVDAENAVYSSVDGVLFNKNKETLIRYPRGKPGIHFNIPSSVTAIGDHAFFYCYIDSCESSESISVEFSCILCVG